jgi:hypothetical protein
MLIGAELTDISGILSTHAEMKISIHTFGTDISCKIWGALNPELRFFSFSPQNWL